MLRIHHDTLNAPATRAYLMTLPAEARTAIILTVHDEVVLDLPAGSYPMERFREQMVAGEPWMQGLPIAVDLWNNPRYGKRG
jgi:hypothetical protein